MQCLDHFGRSLIVNAHHRAVRDSICAKRAEAHFLAETPEFILQF